MAEEACCDETINTDLKPLERPNTRRTGDRKVTMFNWVASRNHLLEVVSDTKEIKDTFKQYPLIPYAGTTLESGHLLLRFFKNMVKLSDTHGSCIEKLKFFCFGGKIEVKKLGDPVFDLEESEDLDINLKKEFIKMLNSVKINSGSWKDLGNSLFEDFKGSGNGYFVTSFITTLGIKSISIKYYSDEECIFVKTEKGNVEIVAISPDFSVSYLKKNPPLMVPLYPYWSEENGVQTTIYQIKKGTKRYGRPDSQQASLYFYREFQDPQYLSKQSDNEFTPKTIIEKEVPDQEEDEDEAGDFDTIADRMKANFTNNSDDPMSFVYMTRAEGAGATTITTINPNTNENYYLVLGGMSEKKIIRAHKMSMRLMGDSQGNKMAGNSAFLDELKIHLPVFEEYQSIIEIPLNTMIQEIVKFLELPQLEGIGIKFKSPFKHMLDEGINNSKGGSELQPGQE